MIADQSIWSVSPKDKKTMKKYCILEQGRSVGDPFTKEKKSYIQPTIVIIFD